MTVKEGISKLYPLRKWISWKENIYARKQGSCLYRRFNGKEILSKTIWITRKSNYGTEQWYFSVVDVVSVLTDSADPKQYLKKMRTRDPELNARWGTICTPTKMQASDGKFYSTQAATAEGIFRIIQSIPSPKAEPFKLRRTLYRCVDWNDIKIPLWQTASWELPPGHWNNHSTCRSGLEHRLRMRWPSELLSHETRERRLPEGLFFLYIM